MRARPGRVLPPTRPAQGVLLAGPAPARKESLATAKPDPESPERRYFLTEDCPGRDLRHPRQEETSGRPQFLGKTKERRRQPDNLSPALWPARSSGPSGPGHFLVGAFPVIRSSQRRW